MVLGACMKPVDVKPFLESETVQKIIESTTVTVTVIVDDKTGDGLVGRDRRIEGLKNDKYYMVEKEIDADNILATGYPKYVTDHHPATPTISGALWGELGYITRISAGRINGLINFHTYTVRAAEPLAPSGGSLQYTDNNAVVSTKPVTGGVINITSVTGTGTGSLDLSGVITAETEVMAVSVNHPLDSPWDWYSKAPVNWTSFALDDPDTTVDYVFVKKNGSLPPDFKFLRVIVGPDITPGALTLNISFNEVNGTPTLTPAGFAYNQSAYYNGTPQSVTINVSNAGNYTIVEWKYDGKSTSPGTGSSITLNSISGDIDYLALGTHTITLICTKDGKPYSAGFTLTVGP